MRISCILLIALANVACRGDSNRAPDGTTDSGFGPHFLVTTDLRIDGMQADLVPIGGVAVAADGTIAVLQGQDYIIRFFSADGEPIGSFGGHGEGPGEFEDMVQLAWLADTLVVYDQELRRFTLISPKREFVRTVRATVGVRPGPANAGTLPEHAMIVPHRLYADGSVGGAIMGLSGNEGIWARVSPDGQVESVVLQYASGGATVSTIKRTATGVGGISVGMPFAWRTLYSVSQDGSRATMIRIAEDDADVATFQVTAISTRGDTLFSRAYPFERVPIPDDVADSAIEALARRWQDSNPELATAVRREARVPPFYSPIERVANGRDGTIWIRLRQVPEGSPYLILDAAGQPIGTVLLPPGTVVQVADRRNVWAVERDENDVQSIVRYRVVQH